MRRIAFALALLASPAAASAAAAHPGTCRLTPKQVVTRFVDAFYLKKEVKSSFERWVDPGYIQHNPYAATGRDAAVTFLSRFMADNPGFHSRIVHIIADGNLVAVHSHSWMKDGDPGTAVVDIFRVKGCRVMEHWDVVQQVPEKSANANGMF